MVQTPDEVIILRAEKCARCQTSLQGVKAQGCERRQRIDLPEIKVQVTEYQAQDVVCPHCQHVTRGTFPDELRASVQFGPMIKGIALSLLYGQLLPYARTAELLTDLCGCHISPSTLETYVREAHVIGDDETGIRVQGVLHWMHVARTDRLTHDAVHRKRGKQATDEIGILPEFHGISEHDAYSLYRQYTRCEHGLCNAHNLRDLCFLHEHEKQQWAADLKEHLLTCHAAVEQARQGSKQFARRGD